MQSSYNWTFICLFHKADHSNEIWSISAHFFVHLDVILANVVFSQHKVYNTKS